MLAKNGTQLTCLRLIAATEQLAISGTHDLTKVAVALILEEQIHGGVADAENLLQHTAFQVVQGHPLPNRLVNLVGEAICQIHEDFSLANALRRCDDHATASMQVVLDYTHQHDKEADFCLAQSAYPSEPPCGRTVTPMPVTDIDRMSASPFDC